MLYLTYYNLNEKPFHASTDPNYFWVGEAQKEAIAILNFGIQKGSGVTVLTGDVGTGKTVLVKYLASLLKDRFTIAMIEDSNIESQDLLLFLADSLNLTSSFDDKSSFFRYADEEYSKSNRRMLIILDEAHRSTDSLLSDLSQMIKIKRNNEQLINFILVGQNSLRDLIRNHQAFGNKKYPPTLCDLRVLTKAEIHEYINHRLKIAGIERKLFSSGAVSKIFRCTGGVPRIINTICDHALMIGYSNNLKEIKSSVIKESAKDLLIEPGTIGYRATL